MSRLARLIVVFALAVTGLVTAQPASAARAPAGSLNACEQPANIMRQIAASGIPCSEINRAINEAIVEFRLDGHRFRKMIKCESYFRPQVTNGQYGGLTQQGNEFVRRWSPRFNRAVDVDLGAGRARPSKFHPWDNVRLAAYVISLNGYSEWQCKGN